MVKAMYFASDRHRQVYEPGQRGWGVGRSPSPGSGKAIVSGANAEFFGQKPAGKKLKKYVFVIIKRKRKQNPFHPVR